MEDSSETMPLAPKNEERVCAEGQLSLGATKTGEQTLLQTLQEKHPCLCLQGQNLIMYVVLCWEVCGNWL